MPRIAPAVKAAITMFLNLEEYPIGKTPHSCAPPHSVDDRELQGMFRDCFNHGLDRQHETLPKLGASAVIPSPRIL
jgi:hypothetical protein